LQPAQGEYKCSRITPSGKKTAAGKRRIRGAVTKVPESSPHPFQEEESGVKEMKSISTPPALTAHQLKKREPGKEAQLLRMQSWKPLDASDPLPALSELFNDAECSLYSLLAGTTTACQTKPKCHISNQWTIIFRGLLYHCSKLYYKALCPVRFALSVPGIISTPVL